MIPPAGICLIGGILVDGGNGGWIGADDPPAGICIISICVVGGIPVDGGNGRRVGADDPPDFRNRGIGTFGSDNEGVCLTLR